MIGFRIGPASIILLALALGILAVPLAGAQEPAKVPRIGYLSPRPGPTRFDAAFRQGLRELGYVEGKNIVIESRYAGWDWDRLAAQAADLVHANVDILVTTGGTTTALVAKRLTTAIPIVFSAGDPVGAGLVPSLAHPGGNITGVNNLTAGLNVKRLQLLKEAVPDAVRIAVLVNPTNATSGEALKEMQDASRSLGVRLLVKPVREQKELANAFATLTRERADALAVVSDPLYLAQREHIVALAAKSHLPAVYEFREFAESGGLMSYGANIVEVYRRLATYVDKILKGANPADLPVEQPTKFELVINLKTAKTLGLTVPQPVLIRADEVIR